MKLRSSLPFSLNIWTTNQQTQKLCVQFLKEVGGDHSSVHILDTSLTREILSLRAQHSLYSIVIIDEGELAGLKKFINIGNTLFFVLTSEWNHLPDVEQQNIFYISSLQQFFTQWDFIIELAVDQYWHYFLECGNANLKVIVRELHHIDISILDSEQQKFVTELLIGLLQGKFNSLVDALNILPFGKVQEVRLAAVKNLSASLDGTFILFKQYAEGGLLYKIEKEFLDSFALLCLVLVYRHFYTGDNSFFSDRAYRIYRFFPYPFAVINSGEILFYSEKLLELNISARELEQLENKMVWHCENEEYQIRRVPLELGELVLCIPCTRYGKERSISSQELGIITSSIAHELNNPLAGILSAVTVLQDEPEWSNQEQEYLTDINMAALRCKKIVSTFLGFSRSSVIQEQEYLLIDVLNQALDLIRYRSAELDLRIILHMEECKSITWRGSAPIVTMFFYLLYAEILTLLNHEKLVKITEHSLQHIVDIYITYEKPKISISFDHISPNLLVKLNKFVHDSKLIEHLLLISKLNFRIEHNQSKILMEQL